MIVLLKNSCVLREIKLKCAMKKYFRRDVRNYVLVKIISQSPVFLFNAKMQVFLSPNFLYYKIICGFQLSWCFITNFVQISILLTFSGTRVKYFYRRSATEETTFHWFTQRSVTCSDSLGSLNCKSLQEAKALISVNFPIFYYLAKHNSINKHFYYVLKCQKHWLRVAPFWVWQWSEEGLRL